MYEASAALADSLLGQSVDEPHQLSLFSRNRIADRVTRVNEVTRTAIRRTIRAGMADGLSNDEIAETLRDKVRETYRGRADTIARTETAIVDQEAAHDRYRAGGITHVRISDGASCGWTSHEDPDKANDSVRTLDEAARYPIAHPNCVRSSAPEIEI